MLLMRRRFGISMLLLSLGLVGASCGQQAESEPVVHSEEFKQRIADYLADLNKNVSEVQVEEITPLEDSPFLSVRLSFLSGQQRQSTELFVSEDGRHLILGQIWDLNLAPIEARWAQLRRSGKRNLETLDLENRPAKGNLESEVVVVEFSDYQCPYCATAHSGLEQPLLERYGDRIRFVYKHLPLTSIHPWALKASIAATCGYVQSPEAFWTIHGRLFESQKEITAENLRTKAAEFAADADLNAEEFLECFDSERTKAVVMNDMKEASSLGITSTPTFLLNGAPFRGAPGFDEFAQFIDMALKDASAN